MIRRYDETDDDGKPINGFVVECDCCGERMDPDGFIEGMCAVFEYEEDAADVAETNDWIAEARGKLVICPDCKSEIMKGNVELEFIRKGESK